jgi:hypothetical protein
LCVALRSREPPPRHVGATSPCTTSSLLRSDAAPRPGGSSLRPRPVLRHTRVLSFVAAAAFTASVVVPAAGGSSDRGVWTRPGGKPVAAAAAAADEVERSTTSVEPYAPHEGQTTCAPEEQPGVRAFRDLVLAAYPGTEDGGIVRDCAAGGRSEHKEGRAWDWMLDAHDPADAAAAAEILEWLLAPDADGEPHALARRLGVMYVIWDGRIWTSSRPESWQPYGGASPHEDHVHVSFGHEGAAGTTSFWDPVWQPEVGESFPEILPADGGEVQAAPPGVGADASAAG